MQITAGTLRGRRLLSPKGSSIRPSASRTREALFNLLIHAPPPPNMDSCISGQRVADICCGCGLLGFEAISRGAAWVTFVDSSRESLALSRDNAQQLKLSGNMEFLQADVASLPKARQPYAAVLCDPPYQKGLAEPLLRRIIEGGWLVEGGYVAVETAKGEALPEVAGLSLYKDREYGTARLALFRRLAVAAM